MEGGDFRSAGVQRGAGGEGRDERAGGIANGEQGVVHAVADDFERERQAAGGIRAGEGGARVFPAGSV